MSEQESLCLLDEIVAAMTEAGYEPCSQLAGYLQSGDICYITRNRNARGLISRLEKKYIQDYLDRYLSN